MSRHKEMQFNGPSWQMEDMTCSVRADFAFLAGLFNLSEDEPAGHDLNYSDCI